jgi:hypothetical protein
VIRRILMLVFTLSACSGQVSPTTNSNTHAGRVAILDQIAKKCNLPSTTFELVGLDEMHFRPSADARYEDVDCALRELKKSPFPMKMGFIGNEAYSDEGNSQ